MWQGGGVRTPVCDHFTVGPRSGTVALDANATLLGQVGDTACDPAVDPGFTCHSITCALNFKCIPADATSLCRGG